MKKKTSSIVECKLMGIDCKIDGEKHWRDFTAQSSEERLTQCSDSIHFLIQLHFMDISEKIRNRFLKYFSTPAAQASRKGAIDGLVAKNYAQADHLLSLAQSFIRDRDSGEYSTDTDSGMAAMAAIALGFADIINNRDVSSLQRMIKIIENKGVPDGVRGGVGAEERYMLEKFTELHLTSRSLPTKKALRDACGLGAREDEKLATKRMKKFGLWGLPTEPEI